ncbi:hypothetical protein Pst134EA_017585 [Puccinia striiformis f. sp. tritici]|uniref:hypothetical protein n=1 Tax=Puccinia striiformis f. sp. tritici TaxID=168172 RepID=UPI000A1234FD|nr:hypothetical protein Pst134EA_017585 [Puccinia striiformis f. sp. tritici]KAH9461278.1 hypothetical protein Pst134EA_017585 [Puccinia striiformis f. sp. tritici]
MPQICYSFLLVIVLVALSGVQPIRATTIQPRSLEAADSSQTGARLVRDQPVIYKVEPVEDVGTIGPDLEPLKASESLSLKTDPITADKEEHLPPQKRKSIYHNSGFQDTLDQEYPRPDKLRSTHDNEDPKFMILRSSITDSLYSQILSNIKREPQDDLGDVGSVIGSHPSVDLLNHPHIQKNLAGPESTASVSA